MLRLGALGASARRTDRIAKETATAYNSPVRTRTVWPTRPYFTLLAPGLSLGHEPISRVRRGFNLNHVSLLRHLPVPTRRSGGLLSLDALHWPNRAN